MRRAFRWSRRFAAVAVARFLVGACVGAQAPAPPPHDATWVEPVTGMVFVRVPAGTFEMGSHEGERGREAGETPHRVTITRAFDLGRDEVTQAEWVRVMGSNPSHFTGCDRCPVENVTWHDVQAYITKLSAVSGETLRLPTEAEWEYACRAGTRTAYNVGETLTTAQANVDARHGVEPPSATQFRGRTMPVGSFAPNAWGLRDMHGNVWEWCADRACAYPAGAVTDPVNACDSPFMAIRGGSWRFNVESARSALRYTHRPEDRGPSLGFRLVREVPRGGRR